MRLNVKGSLILSGLSLALMLIINGSAFGAQRSLAGSQWRLDSFGRAGDEKPIVDGTSITIQFGTDGRATGSSGCNSYSGTYNAEGEHLSFGQMISTMRACVEPKANQQEQTYMAALRAITRFTITESRLTLSDGGEVVLNFSSQPSSNGQEPGATTPGRLAELIFRGDKTRSNTVKRAVKQAATISKLLFSQCNNQT